MDDFQLGMELRQADDADPRVSGPLQAAKSALGMVPNMYAAMANFPPLLETYSTGYAKFRSDSGFTSIEQEIVFLTISRFNECTYCMAAHSAIADTMSRVPPDVTEAIRTDQPIVDSKLETLRNFVWAMVETRGRPSPASGAEFLAAGYDERHVLAVILAIAVKTISNFSNHLFATEIDNVFAHRKWAAPSRS